MKKTFSRIAAATLAGVLLIAPLSVNAAEIKTTEYNSDVTKSDGSLKLGYHETTDSSKTWWKTVTSYTDWTETDENGYNQVSDDDLKKVDETERTSWRVVDYETYAKYVASSPDDAKTDGYTRWTSANYDTYKAASDDLRSASYGQWYTVDKNTYDSISDPESKKAVTSDWYSVKGNTWAAKYSEWLKYDENSRKFTATGDFTEVSKEEYLALAEKFNNQEGVLYKYEDVVGTSFTSWPVFNYQIIANDYNITSNAHDPYNILVENLNITGNYSGCEGGTSDGKNDGINYFDESNGTDAKNVAKGVMDSLKANNVAYTTIKSSSDIPTNVGTNKFNSHVNDVNYNAGGTGNAFIDIVDEDFKIYYYEGTDTINVEGFYGILIAPNATVKVGGKWIGTIIADTVETASNSCESSGWTYPTGKGTTDRKYYASYPTLEVRCTKYSARCACYYVRDHVYKVRDIVKKYYVRSTTEEKFYCETSPYVPQTGDVSNIYKLIALISFVVGATFIIISIRKRKKCSNN